MKRLIAEFVICALIGTGIASAMVGAVVVALAAFGSFGIGHFRLYYGGDPIGCTKMEYAKTQQKEVRK